MTEPVFFSDVYERKAAELGDRPYILFEDGAVSFAAFNRRTRQVANGLAELGARAGDGVAVMMGNCPEYLELVNGLQRGGYYGVPVNIALKGDGLRYILTHSDSSLLVVDDVFLPEVRALGPVPGRIRNILVRRTGAPGFTDAGASDLIDLATLWQAPDRLPAHRQEMGAVSMLLYTSGTTGFPKAVVNRVRPGGPQGIHALASLWVRPDDVLFTCLPLFHANALSLTAAPAMMFGIPFGLERRFSASRFWEPIRRWGVTSFNALGAMIPILMKQPERPDDAINPVRLVLSAACPKTVWRAFERRFGVEIMECYGAVDGGGVMIFNRGDAPVGSVGRLPPTTEWKLVDDVDRAVAPGETGELITRAPEGAGPVVEYYKNAEASAAKVRAGWIRSGDLFTADESGNLFFVDRKTDSIRRRGENISSWDVESALEKHPDIVECAAFGVPSELGEDEVMVLVVPRPGSVLSPETIVRHAAEHLAYFMVPRYVEIVNEVPRTGTHRAKKTELKKRGVTAATWDREKVPELAARKS
jgi:crotonobetaine/carnitine-CoA ligase